MGGLKKYLKGWEFRSSTPGFERGEKVFVEINGYDEDRDRAVARVGDTHLHIKDLDDSHRGQLVQIQIDSFDETNHTGEAHLVE